MLKWYRIPHSFFLLFFFLAAAPFSENTPHSGQLLWSSAKRGLPPMTPAFEATHPTSSQVIQLNNPNPKHTLIFKPSGELADNRLGVLAGGLTGGGWKPGQPWDYRWMADQITGRGLKRFRVAIDNLDANSPDLDWDIPQYTIDPSHDALITTLARQGVVMTFILTFWDKDTWPGGVGAPCPRFKKQDEIDRYLDFARFVVNHFKDRIQNYEIWNEPDNPVCPQRIDPPDYLNLVRQAAPVIHAVYPDARIVVGATTYLGETESQDYLFKILKSNVMPLVDVISWHPMYGTTPEFNPDYYARYPIIVNSIKETARQHGFRGSFEADELTWFTLTGQNWDGWSRRYDDLSAAKYTARAVVTHLAMDVTAGLGSALIFDAGWEATPRAIRNLSGIMAGVRPSDFPLIIESPAPDVKVYTFSTPNGGALAAYWSDLAARGDFKAAPATITIQGRSGLLATGVDILEGYRQELITKSKDGDLIIAGLQVKDYPVFLLLSY